jgi:hypothetical protein
MTFTRHTSKVRQHVAVSEKWYFQLCTERIEHLLTLCVHMNNSFPDICQFNMRTDAARSGYTSYIMQQGMTVENLTRLNRLTNGRANYQHPAESALKVKIKIFNMTNLHRCMSSLMTVLGNEPIQFDLQLPSQ